MLNVSKLLCAALLLLMGFTAGCKNGAPPLDLRRRAAYQALKDSVPGPVDLTLDVRVLPPANPIRLTKETEEVYSVPPALERSARTLAEYLSDLGVVTEVTVDGQAVTASLPGGERVRLRVATGPPVAGRAVLEVRPQTSKVSYKGYNDYIWGNSVLLFFGGLLAWFVPDEQWAAELEWEVVLRDGTGREVGRDTIAVNYEQGMNDYDRGWDFWEAMVLYLVLDPGHFEVAERTLMPQAEAAATLALAEKLVNGDLRDGLLRLGSTTQPGPVEPDPVEPGPVEPGPVEPGPVEPGPVEPGPVEPGPVEPGPVEPGPVEPGPVTPTRTPIVRGIVLGVTTGALAGEYPDEVAPNDARDIAGLLVKPPVKAKQVISDILVDTKAGEPKLRAQLSDLRSSNLQSADRVVLYFAGRGTTLEDGRPAIVCQGGDPATGEGCVGLDEIRDACGQAKVILFLDGSFAGKEETRGPGFDGAELLLPPQWATSNRFVVFTAATDGSAEVRYVQDDDGIIETGLFTQGVRELLRGQGDTDDNGVVTAAEATAHLVARVAALKGTAAPAVPARIAGADDTPLWTTGR